MNRKYIIDTKYLYKFLLYLCLDIDIGLVNDGGRIQNYINQFCITDNKITIEVINYKIYSRLNNGNKYLYLIGYCKTYSSYNRTVNYLDKIKEGS